MNNRIIEFRCWDEKRKSMYINPCQSSPPKGCKKRDWFVGFNSQGLEISEYEGKGHWRQLHIMQFTGLLDCNGQKIWEGDIVKRTKTDRGLPIIWDEYRACFSFAEPTSFILCRDWATMYEVIGNVFEDGK
jgi:uncharacterized phage protein (TIGR01671 family)